MADSTLNANSFTLSITVKDLAASTKWYTDVLGFAVEQEYDREGKPQAVVLNGGQVRMLLNQDDGAKGWDRIKGQGFMVTINVVDVDAVAARAKAAGATLEAEPEDKPWGARSFPIIDPDGFKLAVSRPL